MIELQFRFWDKRFNKFRYDLLISNEDVWDIEFCDFCAGVENVSEHVVVQQYTRLNDKNGVEICEGDFLKIEFRDIDGSTHMIKAEVVYHDNGFYEKWGGELKVLVGSTTHEYNGKKFTLGSSEVVGNIFEGVGDGYRHLTKLTEKELLPDE